MCYKEFELFFCSDDLKNSGTPIAIGAAFKEIGVKKKRIIRGILKFNWHNNLIVKT